jgi:NADPH-dependent 2,4-dienoyl-CoA reductase/sulfur reductase-like enzyme
MRVVIVGGVAGGMSAATRLRRVDESAEIVVFERGPEVSYANCGLPYYVGGVIEDRSSLLLQTPESLRARFDLDVRVRHEVLRIDRDARTVTVRNGVTGEEIVELYDALVLAVGASSRPRDIAGVPRRSLRTVEDADEIAEFLGNPGRRPAVVVLGGGYTGVEAAENFARRGAAVTLVHRGDWVLGAFDAEMAAPIASTLRASGIDVRTGVQVTGVQENRLRLSDGGSLPADLLVDATGVSPDVRLAHEAGLAIGDSGGIAVDAQQRTSDPAIFAIGDAAEKTDAVSGLSSIVTMAGLANRHGRMVADIISGRTEHSRAAVGTGIVSVFGLAAARVGWNERQLTEAGVDHYVVHVHPASNAGYYPGSAPLAMKLLASRDDDRILGAQVVGEDGVDKRIDVIATAMQAGIPAGGLSELELAYAPQFGSAKDPVNIAGYVARNTLDGTTPTIQWHELDHAVEHGATVIDVRTAAEHAAGAIPGAVNVPLDDLRTQLARLPQGPIVVHCQVGQRGHYATRILRQHGFDAVNLDGGYRTWLAGTSAAWQGESRAAA